MSFKNSNPKFTLIIGFVILFFISFEIDDDGNLTSQDYHDITNSIFTDNTPILSKIKFDLDAVLGEFVMNSIYAWGQGHWKDGINGRPRLIDNEKWMFGAPIRIHEAAKPIEGRDYDTFYPMSARPIEHYLKTNGPQAYELAEEIITGSIL